MKKKFKWILYLLSLELLFVLLFIINTKIYKSDFTFENIFTKKCKFILRDFSDGNFIIWILYTACLGMKKSIKYILQTAEDIYSRVMIFYGN